LPAHLPCNDSEVKVCQFLILGEKLTSIAINFGGIDFVNNMNRFQRGMMVVVGNFEGDFV
jgi:hypothetical protein